MTVRLQPQLCGRQHFNSGCWGELFFFICFICVRRSHHTRRVNECERFDQPRGARKRGYLKGFNAKCQIPHVLCWHCFDSLWIWAPDYGRKTHTMRHVMSILHSSWWVSDTHTHTKISENKGEDTWDSPCCMGGHMHLCLFFMPSTCGSTLSSHRLSHFVSLLLMCVCVCVWGNQSCEKKMVLDENSDLTYSHPPPPWERFKKMREGVFCSSRPPHFLGGCHVGQLSR